LKRVGSGDGGCGTSSNFVELSESSEESAVKSGVPSSSPLPGVSDTTFIELSAVLNQESHPPPLCLETLTPPQTPGLEVELVVVTVVVMVMV
jgi:hypothetical protein